MTKDHIEKLRAFLMERLAEKNNTIFHEAHFEELIAVCNVALGVMPLTDNNGAPLTRYVPSSRERGWYIECQNAKVGKDCEYERRCSCQRSYISGGSS